MQRGWSQLVAIVVAAGLGMASSGAEGLMARELRRLDDADAASSPSDTVPVKAVRQSPQQAPSKSPVQAKSPVQMADKTPVQVAAKSPVQMKSPAQIAYKSPVQMAYKSPVQMAYKSPVQMAAGDKCCAAPKIKYQHHCTLRKTCDRCCDTFQTVLTVCNPHCGEEIDIPLCLPACCEGEPKVCDRSGVLGRSSTTYEWCCGYRVKVVIDRCGDVAVHTYGR
jgi:hypothetical protein